MAKNPVNNAAGDVTSPTQGEDGEIGSWLGELRPPRTNAPWPAGSTNGDDPDATPAIPPRRQQDPDAT